MFKVLITVAVIAGLSGCVVAPPYAYSPGYYAAPVVSIGGGGYWRVR
jgi:hypothetical protein